MSKTKFLAFLALALSLATPPVVAAPGLMNYSGRLVNIDGTPVPTSTAAQFTFCDTATARHAPC